MGTKNSKTKCEDFKEKGTKANKDSPNTYFSYSTINLSNEIIVGKAKKRL